jgi:hypothetical protein
MSRTPDPRKASPDVEGKTVTYRRGEAGSNVVSDAPLHNLKEGAAVQEAANAKAVHHQRAGGKMRMGDDVDNGGGC